MSSDESPSSSTYHPSDLPSSLSDTIPTDYDEEEQQSQPPPSDEPPIPTTNSTNTPSSIDHKFHLLETRLSGFAESLLGIATCLDSLQEQITSLSSSSLSLSSSSTFLQKEKDDDDDENLHLEEENRESVVDGQEREEQKGIMMGEEKEEEVGGKESNEDEAEDMAEQRPEGGGDGKVNNEGFLGEVISGILNGDDGEVES